MDRALRANVIAKSGKAVETAGDLDTLLLDKTGTITIGNRKATAFYVAPNVTRFDLVNAAVLSSVADETPEGKSIVELGKNILADAEITAFNEYAGDHPAINRYHSPVQQNIAFTAETRPAA